MSRRRKKKLIELACEQAEAAGIVQLFVLVRPARDQITQEHARDRPVSDAMTGIARSDIDVLCVARIFSDIRQPVERLDDLPGPTVNDFGVQA